VGARYKKFVSEREAQDFVDGVSLKRKPTPVLDGGFESRMLNGRVPSQIDACSDGRLLVKPFFIRQHPWLLIKGF